MQSEISSHIGGKGNCFCRKCRVGGTQKEKATDEGYHALFEVFIFSHIGPRLKYPDKAGVPRTKEYIILELEKQVKLACSGVIKPVKALQTETGVKDTYTGNAKRRSQSLGRGNSKRTCSMDSGEPGQYLQRVSDDKRLTSIVGLKFLVN
jgi:hypothetical protein